MKKDIEYYINSMKETIESGIDKSPMVWMQGALALVVLSEPIAKQVVDNEYILAKMRRDYIEMGDKNNVAQSKIEAEELYRDTQKLKETLKFVEKVHLIAKATSKLTIELGG